MAITFKKKYKDEMTGEWACPVCEVKMDSQHAFTVHIRQHNPTDHSHTCSICAKQLSSASSLDRHMLIHSGERPFKCRVCNMAFTTNGNMHRHEKTHGIYGPGSRVRGSNSQDQQALNYLNSSTLDEDGLRVRDKKKRKPKSLPNSNSPNNANAQSQNSSFGCFDDLSLKETFLSLLQLQQQNRNFNGDFNFDGNSNDNSSTTAALNLYNQLPKSLNQLNQKLLNNDKDKLLNDDLDEHRSTTSSEEQQENLLNKSGSNGLFQDNDEINKLAFKRSLAQNSTLYNTLLNNSNLLNNSLTATATSINGNSSSLNVSALNKPDLADFSSIFAVISNAQQQFPFNDEQMAKLNQLATNQLAINQQALQDQSTLLNSNSISIGTKQTGKRSRNSNQINGISNRFTNGTTNGKRVKRESKNSIEKEFNDQLNSLTNLNSLNSLSNLNNLTGLKNSSLNSINNLINSTTKEDDQRSDKSSAKNGSDIENEMTNSNKQQIINDKASTVKLNSSTTSQQLTNNEDTIDDNTIEDEDEFSRNLSEEEEVNKMEQEFSEQIKDEEKNKNEESEDKDDEKKSTTSDEDKKDEQIKASSNLLKNGLASLIVPKKSTAPVNLADLIVKSDKNNNKNMRNNNGSDLNQHLFIDPMAEDDVKLLEKQLQDQQYLCKNCGLEVRSVNTLRRHQRLHESGGQLYGCNFCTYTSLDKSSLIRHLRTHNGERPYQCTICKYAFTTKANCERHVRKRHKKIEKDDINFSMQYKAGSKTDGGNVFPSLNSGLHKNNNQNDLINNSALDSLPPSSLVETNKSLLASSNMHLIPHVFYEPNSMETSCRFCNKDFLFNRLLKQHIRTMMNNNFTKKPYNCILCNQGFTTKNTCVRHFEKNHKDVPHDQIQNMIIENRSLLEDQRLNNSANRLSNGGLNASALAAFSSPGSGSELMSNGDSCELDQPLNLANGFYNSLNKINNHLSNDKYIMDEDFGDEDNQNALDLSVKSNERTSIDQLSSMSRSLDLSAGSTNNQLNEPNGDMIRNAISALLAIQSAMPKSLNNNDNNQLITSSLLGNQTNNLNTNMGNLLAVQQLQNNLNPGSLLNLFTSLNNLSTPQF